MVRMTVHQAADLWRVNRRTILKWIMGKDSTGRGKRLVEGEDYEVVDADVDGRKMYVLLRDAYPVPRNTAPIPRVPRGPQPRKSEPLVSEEVPAHTRYEQQVARAPGAGSDRYNLIDSERHPGGPVTPVQAAAPKPVVAPEPESIPMAPPEPVIPAEPVEVVAPQPKPRPRRVVQDESIPTIDSDLPTQREKRTREEIEEEKAERTIRVESVEPDPKYVGLPIKDQFKLWVPTMSNEPMDLADPVAAIARVTLREAMLDADVPGAADFIRLGQPRMEFHLRRVLEQSPLTREARNYAGGAVLEFLQYVSGNKLKLAPSPSGYWPKQGQLSGLSTVSYLPLYEWM